MDLWASSGDLLLELLLRVGPILGFLVCITIVAELSDRIGIFRALAYVAARLGRGSVFRLWLLVVVVATVCTAVLSLDTTAVLLTPVVLMLARLLSLQPLLFAYTTVWLANTASLILPVSNLTNLLAVSWLATEVDGGAQAATVGGFVQLMWPAAAAALVITVGALLVIFRRSLRGHYDLPRWRSVGDRLLFGIAAVVCAALGPAFALGLNVFAASGVAALILVLACAARRRDFLSWKLVPWQMVLGVAALFLLVQIGHQLGLTRLLSQLAGSGESGWDLLRLTGIGAAAANMINNLPAFLALEPLADTPLRVASLLVGVNAGPLIVPWASLATLLWAARCRAADVAVAWPQFILRGAVLVPLLIVGCTAATLVVHQ